MDPMLPQERGRQRAEGATDASTREEIESLLHAAANPVLLALARNPYLQEGDLLRLLDRKDLSREVVAELAARKEVRRSYAIQLALARHPKTPRLISLPLLKFFYLFDLLRVAQTPAAPADVKMAAEETILKKLAGMPRGEKISLARRGTGRLSAALLDTTDPELIQAGLSNPYLTEGHLLKVLAREELSAALLEQLALHPRWSQQYHLRLALIRHPLTPFARVQAFLPDMAIADLRDVSLDHRMPQKVRSYIEGHCAARLARQRRPSAPE